MLAVIVIVLILLLNLWWFTTIRHYNSLKNIPGPQPLPFVGNALSIGRNPQEFLLNLCGLSKHYGGIFKIFVGTECKVFIADADVMEKIVTSNVHISKSDIYVLLSDWLGDGLLTSTGEKWKRRRKLLTPCFHFTILEKFMTNFTSVADELVARLQNAVGGESFDILPYVNVASLTLMCESSMGLKINSQGKENVYYVEAVRGYLSFMLIRAFSAWKRIDSLYKFAPSYQKWKHFINVLHVFAENIIEKRREDTKSHNFHTNADEMGIKSKIALLDFLLKAEREHLINADDIKDEINTFLFAGHDTITAGTTFLMLLLSRHEDVQQKVFEEVVQCFGDLSEEKISVQNVQNLHYLDCVIKETLRLYPPAPLVERCLHSELTIDGFTFPTKTNLSLFLYGLHHNEKYFPEPEKFDPSRFFPENVSKRHNYCYLPFSAGPRNCLGQRFALLAIKVLAIKMVSKYKVLPVDDFEPDLGLSGVLKTFNGIQVRLHRRD